MDDIGAMFVQVIWLDQNTEASDWDQTEMLTGLLSVVWLCSLCPPVDSDVPPSHNHGPVVMGIPNDHCDNAQVTSRLFL